MPKLNGFAWSRVRAVQ